MFITGMDERVMETKRAHGSSSFTNTREEETNNFKKSVSISQPQHQYEYKTVKYSLQQQQSCKICKGQNYGSGSSELMKL